MTARLPEAYQWLLVPEQLKADSPITWQAFRVPGSDALAMRASKKLRSDESLVTSLGSTILRKHLDDVPLWRGDHVAVKQLVEDFARYLYLPRLTGSEVLVKAIREGIELLTWQSDTFAYAESHDEGATRYRGLRAGQMVSITAESLRVAGEASGCAQPHPQIYESRVRERVARSDTTSRRWGALFMAPVRKSIKIAASTAVCAAAEFFR